ncbi:hypothetical protein FQP66_005122 [Escherichia coli]|nr:hypothetical protein [Escherichia coli]
MIDGNDFILIVGMINVFVCFCFAAVNFRRYLFVKNGDESVQAFVKKFYVKKNHFIIKAVLWLVACLVVLSFIIYVAGVKQ